MQRKITTTKSMAATTLAALLLAACSQVGEKAAVVPEEADKLLIVDCLLPPQVRKLGSNFSYAAARRPVKTSASECEIRGGEYVAYDRADYRTALKVWLPQAEAGDPEAQNYVGQIYEKGLGLPADYQTARHWYEQAAAQGYAEAQINLGYLYEKGLGVEKDPVLALNWYRKASGIEDDTLQYASTVEVARVSQEQLANLQRQLDAERDKNQRLQQEVSAVRDQMVGLDQELQLVRAEKRNKELELELARSRDESPAAAEIDRLQQEIEQYQEKLAAGEKTLQDYQARESSLQDELDSSTLQLASAELNQGLMSIEMIDPPMSITRGVRGTVLASEVKEKEVFGRINTPATIKSLKINGVSHELDEFKMFWVNVPIRDSVTPVEIIATDEFGQTVNYSFSIFSDQTAQQVAAPQKADFELGAYRALIIGNNDYSKIPALQSAVADAEAAEKLLRERYGFKTTLLRNANRFEMLSALDELRRTSGEDDNLLIYFAGHGEIDPVNSRGYWLPVDADAENTANWISNVAITDMINAMPAKHVMVVADSCYSGTLGQSNLASSALNLETNLDMEWVKAMDDIKARIVLTSGGVKPVLDIGGGDHSVFAEAFLSVLSRNEGLMDGHSLYREILRRMRVSMARINQTQVPEYAPIKHAGHEGGEFFLQPVI